MGRAPIPAKPFLWMTWHASSRKIRKLQPSSDMHETLEPSFMNNPANESTAGLNQNSDGLGDRAVSSSDSITSAVLLAESGMEAALKRAEVRIRDACARVKHEIRSYPAEAVLLAAAGGYVCNRLPVRSLLVTGVRIFSAFTPPTLVALGICKVAEYVRRRRADESYRKARPVTPASDAGLVMTDA
jgi:hypothetical protein